MRATPVDDLGSTVCFLAALLVLAEGCRREGLFDAIGALLAVHARGSARRLLALVFAVAAGVTAVLSLDATVVLLTPIVFVTAARMRTSPKPHVYACSHLANSASLLLPVSNLTNLLAFRATGLSFTRFGALMALPWLVALSVEWAVLSRFFGRTGRGSPAAARPPVDRPLWPSLVLSVLALTLVGFALSSVLGIEPVWFASAGAIAISAPALVRRVASPLSVIRSAEPAFLLFVLALGVIVATASENGLETAVRRVLPGGTGLLDLLAIAAACAVLANLVNNLPAILIALPALAAAAGPGPVLAALIGVNVGPNLTYVGSLATLLWRRVMHAQDAEVELGEFLRLGALTVPAVLVGSTAALWLSVRWFA
jgi:arsenical pump membrane protein